MKKSDKEEIKKYKKVLESLAIFCKWWAEVGPTLPEEKRYHFAYLRLHNTIFSSYFESDTNLMKIYLDTFKYMTPEDKVRSLEGYEDMSDERQFHYWDYWDTAEDMIECVGKYYQGKLEELS